MPCRDSVGVTKQKPMSQFRCAGSAADGAGGAAVCHPRRSVKPNQPGKKTKVDDKCPPTRTPLHTTTTISRHLLLFSNSYWTFALRKGFLKRTTTQRQKKEKKDVST